MPRPKKFRRVCCLPKIKEFAPINTQKCYKDFVIMTVDEYETIRLIDYEGLSQEECSAYMNIARTTVQMIYINARKKLAQMLIEGLALKIDGGDFKLCDGTEMRCCHKECHMRRCNELNGQSYVTNSSIDNNYSKNGGSKMKIALPLDEDKKNVCVSFGRAPYFMFYEKDTDKYEIIENPAANAEGGAGIKAAQFVADHDTDVLITVRCGENAADVFKSAEIKIYKSSGNDALDNVKLFKEGKLDILDKFHAGFHGIQ